jgi:hypothetical protein
MPTRNDEQEKKKIIAERNYHHLTENEKVLRHIKACDMVLFMMVKDLLKSLEEPLFKSTDLKKLKLKEVMPDAEKGILSMPIDFKLKFNEKFICQGDMKLKNYGDFRRFLKDNRLKNLVKYFPEKEIAKEKLEKELEQYDKARIEVQRIILEFEKQCSVKYNIDMSYAESDESYPGGKKPYVNHNIILSSWASNNPQNLSREEMENLRSSFMHNDYPTKLSLDTTNSSTIAEKLIEKARELFVA